MVARSISMLIEGSRVQIPVSSKYLSDLHRAGKTTLLFLISYIIHIIIYKNHYLVFSTTNKIFNLKKPRGNRPPPLNLGYVDSNLSFESFSSDTSPDAEHEVPSHSFRYFSKDKVFL